MFVHHLFKPFEIEYKEDLMECGIGQHRNSFFELVYISRGTGIHHVNQTGLPYFGENLFLVMPQDIHFCEVKTATSFLFIRFNTIYFEGQKTRTNQAQLGDWIQKLEYIFQNNTHMPGCIIRDYEDKTLFKALIEGLLKEHSHQKEFHREVLQHLINTIITVVARNISLSLPEQKGPGNDIASALLNYIHQHIYSPEDLKAGHIASHFNISLNYISEFFKKHAGESLQQYITSYKLKLVETRLQYSDMRIGEIVSELGFTDESHLNRTFRKYKGVSPTAFRKQTRINTQLLLQQAI